jgi:hypothetical protein
MASTVFILGAGASKQGGAPLMNEFFDRARWLLNAEKLSSEDKVHFEHVEEIVRRLGVMHSKWGTLDIHNVESVFATLDMAKLLGRRRKRSATR